jgi:hypothetical protein
MKKNMCVHRQCNFRREKCNKESSRDFIKINTLIEIESVFNVKTKVIPVSIEATGTFSQSFRNT